jgi:5-methyltetrahydrofolate--homocysteine methyltransferase
MIKYLQDKECRIIALCMDDSGMPKSIDDIVSRARSLVGELEKIGFKRDDIFIDPLIQPMSVDINNGTIAMTAVKTIMTELEGVHTTGGLSNVSYGLPQRKIINRCFLAMMIANGYDSAIMDPLDKDIMALMHTADMLAGHDQFCMNYIRGVRANKIVA